MAQSEAVYDHMIRLADAFEAQHDKRVIFLRCYAMMTANMNKALAAGEFHDPAWVRPWLDHFASYYFTALDRYTQRPESAPRVWRLTHELTAMPMTAVIEDLVLGINAHINGDLPLALRDMLAPDWKSLTPEQREQRHQDHTHVNEVIGRTTNDVRRDVLERYSHLMCVADHVCYPATELGEWDIGRIIAAWRDGVWNHAVHLLEDTATVEQELLDYDIENGAIHRVRILVSELDLRERLLALPIDELRRVQPNPPSPQQALGKRNAQRLAASQYSPNDSPPRQPMYGSTAPAPAQAEAAQPVQPAVSRQRRWFFKRS